MRSLFSNFVLKYLFDSRYVAPEYANTGMLNEKSDIYSFGVLVLEAVTGRDPIDYSRPNNEVRCYIILIFSDILLLFIILKIMSKIQYLFLMYASHHDP